MLPKSLCLPVAAACLAVLSGSASAYVPSGTETNEAPSAAVAAGTAGPSGYNPPIQPASDEAERALAGFRVPEGMTASLVAAEPLLANPVAFSIDEQGRYWVCETFRQGNAVVDNRGREYWLLDDLAAQTVEDRLAYYKKHLGEEGLKPFSEHHDRIRLLTDTDGDGKVDKSTVFADGFNAPEAGTGSSTLKVGEDLLYTNIPHLWRLRDTNGDGVADERETLLSGFGVRVAFRGHDMHGLVMGPDGRIYFSIGDRGFNVVSKEGERLAMPARGAVFRCEPDGSNLEVFASGLRNPQELAFDDYGNLFTGDNNSDSGDKARWVYVAEGSDSGWRMYYQYLDDRGPWNREMMWLPHETPALDREIATGIPTGVEVKDIQPAYILPPVANVGDGPSGLTHYPGVGLSDRYEGHFFLCDFRGTPNNSGVRSFAVKPKGAGFDLVDSHEFLWSILATDVDFTPDGRLVVSDWVNGWNGEGKGRLYAFSDPDHVGEAAESAKLLAEDFRQRQRDELISLLGHRDRRVRQSVHLALVSQLTDSDFNSRRLQETVAMLSGRGQCHFAWACAIKARRDMVQRGTWKVPALGAVVRMLDLVEADVRATVVRAYGDILGSSKRIASRSRGGGLGQPQSLSSLAPLEHAGRLVALLGDDDLHVRAHSAFALGHVGRQEDIPALLALLDEKGNDDPVIRNAAAGGLAGIVHGSRKPESAAWQLAELARSANAPARRAAVVALRRSGSPFVGKFLNDDNATVVTEAARAINDEPRETLPNPETMQLAALASRDGLNDPTLRRVLNANFRLGGQANAEAVARIASDEATPHRIRIEALTELSLWANPPETDRVTGMYRPIEPRDAAFVAGIVRPHLGKLLAAADSGVRQAAIELATVYKIDDAAPTLREFVSNTERGDSERIAALEGLAAIGADDLNAILSRAVEDRSAALRGEARSIWARHDPEAALPALERTIADGEIIERQSAIATLAEIGSPAADAILARLFDRFVSGQVPREIGLDLVEAAGKRQSLAGRLAAYESGIDPGDKLARWQLSLAGGDAERGRDIFLNRSSVSCLRCHKVEDDRGGEVGPSLKKIGAEKDRDYLLEAIVAPNARIAENFESVIVVTSEGRVITGVKRAEDDRTLTLITAEGQGIVIPKDEIEDRAAGKSAMPEELVEHLSRRDVRDLVEYLAAQQGQGRWEGGE